MNAFAKNQAVARLGRAAGFVWQGSRSWTILNALLVFVLGLLPLVALYLMKLVIDAITAAHLTGAYLGAGGHPPLGRPVWPHVAVLVSLTALVTLASALVRSLSAYASQAQAESVTDRMQDLIHAKSVALDLEFYENPAYHDTFHRAQQEAPARPTRIVTNLVQLTQSFVSLLAIAGLLLFTLHSLFLIILVAAVPAVLFRIPSAKTLYHLRRSQTTVERKVGYYNFLLTLQQFAKEVRLFGLGTLFQGRSRVLRADLRRGRLKIAARRALQDGVAQTCATAAVFGSFAFLAFGAVAGTITLGTMIMYYQAFQRGQSILQDLLASLGELYENNLFLTNLYEFLDLVPRLAEPNVPIAVPCPMRQGLVMENVVFGYAGGTERVLDGVSLTLRPGETLALVGENGAGKSTLIKLLCRLYDPTAGRILLDGRDLREYASTDLRQQIGVVFQDYVQYHLTARENIWLGNLDQAPEGECLRAAACESGAHDVIQSLPQGYDTTLGSFFEGGRELSIGQWQKIAIARAFFRDAQIVILDEPTSALDAEAEFEVFQRFRELAQGKTTLVISHRLSTVRMADRIVVLQRGRIVENGTHAHLIDLKGVYARLFELQAQQYR